ncbi:MAG: thiol oxidoreductase, partial [Gemmatimonadetes bacterium]|nr:thiol oxidoreductase [Gemmatimonadota bacterium]
MNRVRVWLLAAVVALGGCDAVLPDAPADDEVLEGPIDGLAGEQLAAHLAGDAEFARNFGAADGVGPIFVAQACASCHVGDGKGHPVFNLTRFGRMTPGGFDPMRAHGGPQIQHRA